MTVEKNCVIRSLLCHTVTQISILLNTEKVHSAVAVVTGIVEYSFKNE